MLGELGMVLAKANSVPTYKACLSVGEYRVMSILLDKAIQGVLGTSPFLAPFSYLIILGVIVYSLYSHAYNTLSHFITFTPHFAPLLPIL